MAPYDRPTRSVTRDLLVVHSSDIHIDDEYTARLYGGDGTGGLRLVLDAATAVGADLVVLAGDVFEHNRLPLALIDRAARVLDSARMPVVMLPGNHDPATLDGVYRRGGLADVGNVHILGVTNDGSEIFPDLDLEIWGHAHRDYGDMAPLRAPRPRRTARQIAVAHGHYTPVPADIPFPRASWLFGDGDLDATGADYVALGHWNRPVPVGAGVVPAYYSGSPELSGTVNVVRLSPSGDVRVTRRKIAAPVFVP